MGLLGGNKDTVNKGSKREAEALVGIGAAKVGKDPVAYTDGMEWGHFAMSSWLDKNFPCDHREFVILDQKGRPVKAADPFHVYCDAEYKGKRDHSFRQCLNCSIVKTSIHGTESNLMQMRMLLAVDQDEAECPVNGLEKKGGLLKSVVKDSIEDQKSSMTPQEIDEFRQFQEWKKMQG